MAAPGKSLFWRRCRTCFRWCRISLWLAILVFLGVLAYLSEVGLPAYVKRPLLDTLRERGLEVEFTRLRLRWFHGIVADGVRFGKPDDLTGLRLSARQVELNLDLAELMRLRVQVEAVELQDGRFEWSLPGTNVPARVLAMENIDATLRLLPDDQWTLDDFRANFAGAQFTLSAVVTNASAIRDWKFLHPRQPVEPGIWPERLRRLAETLDKISLAGKPELHVVVAGDARNLQSFSGRLSLSTPGADTPWGRADRRPEC
jgi:hypothetical protein